MADKYSGPYKVLERGNKAWKLVGERVDLVSRDHLKPTWAVWPLRWLCRPHVGDRGRSEDGLCHSSGFSFCGREARGACVTDEFYSYKSTSLYV